MSVNLSISSDRDNLSNLEKVALLLNGSISTFKIGDIAFSAEITSNGKPLIHISDGDREFFSSWYFPPKEESTAQRGSKKSYSMLMKKEFKKLLKEHNPTLEEIGAMTELATMYVDWGTGLLSSRKKPLKFEQLCKIFGYKKSKTTQLIKSLKDKKILETREDGYYLSRTFVKRGGAS